MKLYFIYFCKIIEQYYFRFNKCAGLLTKQSIDSDKQLMFPRPPNTVPYISPSLPVEVVLTAGQIALSLYSVDDERSGSARYKGRKKKVSKKVRLRFKNSERYHLFFVNFYRQMTTKVTKHPKKVQMIEQIRTKNIFL